jgi:uncharacterized protein
VNDSANALPARVFLRPIGSPLTLGMAGLTIASFVESGLALHWVRPDQTHAVGLILIAVPFVLQLFACVFSYLARDGATGAAVGVLSTSWLATGLVYVLSRPGQTSGALGLMLAASAGVLALSAFAVGQAKPLPALVFLIAALRFGLDAVHELSGAGFWQNAGGIVGLVLCGVAAYCVLAFELEGQQGRPVIPTFRRGRGASALRDDGAAQLDGVAHEAGVRQTS